MLAELVVSDQPKQPATHQSHVPIDRRGSAVFDTTASVCCVIDRYDNEATEFSDTCQSTTESARRNGRRLSLGMSFDQEPSGSSARENEWCRSTTNLQRPCSPGSRVDRPRTFQPSNVPTIPRSPRRRGWRGNWCRSNHEPSNVTIIGWQTRHDKSSLCQATALRGAGKETGAGSTTNLPALHRSRGTSRCLPVSIDQVRSATGHRVSVNREP